MPGLSSASCTRSINAPGRKGLGEERELRGLDPVPDDLVVGVAPDM